MFNEIVSVPQRIDVIRGAIEDVVNWKSRFNKVSRKTFKSFRLHKKELKRLRTINRKLLRKEKRPALIARLKDNGRKLGELSESYEEIDKGMSAIIEGLRKKVGAQEEKIADRLRASI